jgi:hypothetical protein
MEETRTPAGTGGGAGREDGCPPTPEIVTIYTACHTDPRAGRTAVLAVLNARGVWKAVGYHTRHPLPTEAAEIEALLCALDALTRPWIIHVVTADEEFALGLADQRHRSRDPLAAAGWDALDEALRGHTLLCCEIAPGELVVEGLRQAARHAALAADVEDDLPDIARHAPLLAALELSLHEGEVFPDPPAEEAPAASSLAPPPVTPRADAPTPAPAATYPTPQPTRAQQSLFGDA